MLPAPTVIDLDALRTGLKLVFGEVLISDPAGELAAHATTPSALL